MSGPDTKNKPFVPTNGVPSPNIKPQPSAQNDSVEAAKTMKFLARMFVQFFCRHRPLSTSANPAFIQNTSIPATNTHRVSMPTRRALLLAVNVAIGSAGAAASAAAAASSAQPVAVIPPTMATVIASIRTHFMRERYFIGFLLVWFGD